MGTTYRFIADPGEASDVLDWFRALPTPPAEIEGDGCSWLHFAAEGDLVYANARGAIDRRCSPVATVFLPRVRREVLWTVGEVHFLPTPLREKFPGLHEISRSFAAWLEGHECVYSSDPGVSGEWDYYLEGTVRNQDPPVYALPSGMRALEKTRYFVAEGDTAHTLDRVCAALRLRGGPDEAGESS